VTHDIDATRPRMAGSASRQRRLEVQAVRVNSSRAPDVRCVCSLRLLLWQSKRQFEHVTEPPPIRFPKEGQRPTSTLSSVKAEGAKEPATFVT
jgi:hypothetical protein